MVVMTAPHSVVGPLSLPSLITCLEERIAVMQHGAVLVVDSERGAVVEIGSLPGLLEETVRFCKSVRDGEPSSLADDLHSRLRV